MQCHRAAVPNVKDPQVVCNVRTEEERQGQSPDSHGLGQTYTDSQDPHNIEKREGGYWPKVERET